VIAIDLKGSVHRGEITGKRLQNSPPTP